MNSMDNEAHKQWNVCCGDSIGGTGGRIFNNNSVIIALDNNQNVRSILLKGIWEQLYKNRRLTVNYVEHSNIVSRDFCFFLCDSYEYANYFSENSGTKCRCSNSVEMPEEYVFGSMAANGIYTHRRVKQFRIYVATELSYPDFTEAFCNGQACSYVSPYYTSNQYRCESPENQIYTREECLSVGDFTNWANGLCIVSHDTDKYVCKNTLKLDAYGKYVKLEPDECSHFDSHAATYLDGTVSELGICEGHCNSDSDCLNGYTCFQKVSGQSESILGCNNVNVNHNICYKQSELPAMSTISNLNNNPLVQNLSSCEGNCSTNDNCNNDLSCYKRKGNMPVPGCANSATTGWSYCINVTYIKQPI